MSRIGLRPVVIVLVGLAAAAGAAAVLAPGVRQSGAQAPRITAHARRIGALSRGKIRFALNLRLQERKLDAYLRHVNPSQASRGGLTASEFGARFGPSEAQLTRLRAVLHRLGITVARFYPQRTAMLVRAQRGQRGSAVLTAFRSLLPCLTAGGTLPLRDRPACRWP